MSTAIQPSYAVRLRLNSAVASPPSSRGDCLATYVPVAAGAAHDRERVLVDAGGADADDRAVGEVEAVELQRPARAEQARGRERAELEARPVDDPPARRTGFGRAGPLPVLLDNVRPEAPVAPEEDDCLPVAAALHHPIRSRPDAHRSADEQQQARQRAAPGRAGGRVVRAHPHLL